MEVKLKNTIEDFFEYKWVYDRNIAVSTEDDMKMLV